MNILLAGTIKRQIDKDITNSRSQLIYSLANGLIRKGHCVSVLTTANSKIEGATIIPIIPQAFNDMHGFENPFYAETAYLVQMEKKIEEIGNNFDIIHNHTPPEYINLFATKSINTPIVSTLHLPITPETDTALSFFKNTYFVAISKAQKKQFKETVVKYVIYNGIDQDFFTVNQDKKKDYLLFIGRMSNAKYSNGKFMDPKGVMHAISVAKMTNIALKIVGNVEDKKFYEELIKPHLSDNIQFIGKVSKNQPLTKVQIKDLYQGAKAFLSPINWDEPFGLVMAEAQSCGTPVIAFNKGAVSELITNGKTGFIVENENEMVEAIKKIDSIKTTDCRANVEKNFTLQKMIDEYEKLYKEIINLEKH
jgi:glycosyltransferase involved in cell wall biosynthesis